MSLDAIVKSGIETAFAKVDEYVSRGIYYVAVTNPAYDPASDTMSGAPTAINNVRMLPTKASLEEREASALTISDFRILIPAVDLGAVNPREADTLRMEGILYNVIAVSSVPGKALWMVGVRRK